MFQKVSRFWYCYFLIRLFYLFFTVLVFSKLTTLGDTARYLNAGFNLPSNVLLNSTLLLDFVGGGVGALLGGMNILSNFPFMLLSFFTIKWAIQALQIRKYVNPYLLLTLISLPNFCIWTSVCSKETVGLVFSAILGVLVVNFFKGNYKIRIRDWLAFYLCLVFKPQYLPFIVQALGLTYILNTCCRKASCKFLISSLAIFFNLAVLYLLRGIVNDYAEILPIHFLTLDAGSNRYADIWVNENDFFLKAPWGMFVAFFGPTWNEMCSKPTHFIAGLESIVMLFLFYKLAKGSIMHFWNTSRFHATLIPVYFILFSGICLLHYPFGIFNPGSAIRYRTNFIFLFIILLMHLHVCYKKYEK